MAARVTFRVEVVCLSDGTEQRCSVMEMERAELALETLGMSVAEGKTMLHGVQAFVATQELRTWPLTQLQPGRHLHDA